MPTKHEHVGRAAGGDATLEQWGPVTRGFTVCFPGGESGRLSEIRLRDGNVELLVDAPPFLLPIAVDGADVEAILLPTRRILIRSGALRGDGAAGVWAAGGIVRMPARHSLRLAEHPQEAG